MGEGPGTDTRTCVRRERLTFGQSHGRVAAFVEHLPPFLHRHVAAVQVAIMLPINSTYQMPRNAMTCNGGNHDAAAFLVPGSCLIGYAGFLREVRCGACAGWGE